MSSHYCTAISKICFHSCSTTIIYHHHIILELDLNLVVGTLGTQRIYLAVAFISGHRYHLFKDFLSLALTSPHTSALFAWALALALSFILESQGLEFF